VRPVCLHSRLRSFSRAGSRRMVTAFAMSYNVVQALGKVNQPSIYRRQRARDRRLDRVERRGPAAPAGSVDFGSVTR
jgi:hypothetical protein